jgi:hypothetical protein
MTLAGQLLSVVVLAWDVAVVMVTPQLVRAYIVSRLLVGADAPQWAASRYAVVGAAGAIVYVLWAWSLRFYDPLRPASPQRLPLLNLGAVATLVFLGLFACSQFSLTFDDARFVSRRVLLQSALVIYVATTVAHYLFAVLALRLRGGTHPEAP